MSVEILNEKYEIQKVTETNPETMEVKEIEVPDEEKIIIKTITTQEVKEERIELSEKNRRIAELHNFCSQYIGELNKAIDEYNDAVLNANLSLALKKNYELTEKK